MKRVLSLITDIPKSILGLAAILGIMALALYILNLIPSSLAHQGERRFASLEDARRSLDFPIYLPAYYPDYLQWPPSIIASWSDPGPALSITVVMRSTNQPVLWLEERPVKGDAQGLQSPEVDRLVYREKDKLENGVEAELTEYKDPRGVPYRRLVWTAGDFKIILTSSASLSDVTRMANTMHPIYGY